MGDKMVNYEIVENPSGDTYRHLIQMLCQHSDRFYFITRKELKYNKKILKQFNPFIIEKYKTKEWANTITLGPAATVYVIDVNEDTCRLLQNLAQSLYAWQAPELPEDLTFIKNDFEWFTCTTHEEFAMFSIRSEFYLNLVKQLPGLKLTILE